MPELADLHMHTHFSDGTDSPQEVVEASVKAGLKCIAITDHDTIDGVKPVQEAAKNFDLEVIAGIELSTEANNNDVHILGYFIDVANKNLLAKIYEMQSSRLSRLTEVLEKLKKLGVGDITEEEVLALAKSKSVGRPHIAQILKEKGKVKSIQDAFDKYLAFGAPAYVGKFKQTPEEAIQLIREAGGVAVLAHPQISAVDELIPSFVRAGLGGIEVYYPNVPETLVQFYLRLAKKHNLLVTGGSDAHGKAKVHTYIGRLKVDYSLVVAMKERLSIKK